MFQVDLSDILAGTYQILAFYIVLAAVLALLLTKIGTIDKLIVRLNAKQVARGTPVFKLNYYMVIGILAFIAISTVIIAAKDARGDTLFFLVYSFLAFAAMPVAMGFLAAYVHIIRVGHYEVGNAILILAAGALFAMFGVNLHDFLWCAVDTKWFMVNYIGGLDLQLFYTTFQITDPSRWSYRTFGVYMGIQAGIELLVASLVFRKWIKMNAGVAETSPIPLRRRNYTAYVLYFLASVLLGVVEFVFDFLNLVSDTWFYATVFAGIVTVTTLFVLGGLLLASDDMNKIT
jgi:hypothetical protein